MTTSSRNKSKHANTPQQARANALMGKTRREGGGPRRTTKDTKRALQRKLYNSRIRATQKQDEVALSFIADTLEDLKFIDAEDDTAEAELRRVDEAYQSWNMSRRQQRSAAGANAAAVVAARIPLLLEPQPEGGYTVTSPLLPELITEGDTVEECLTNVEDAFAAVEEIYEDRGRTLPTGIYIHEGSGPLSLEVLLPLPDSHGHAP